MMPGSGFFLLGNSLSRGIELLSSGSDDLDKVENIAQEMLANARDNAPWADRTGAAREGLEVEVAKEGGEIVITLGHTVDYGIWLELIQSGRFAIIMPTIEKYASEIHHAVAEGIFSGG
jgi:hypothetical protein